MKGILKIACLAFWFTVAMTLFSCSNGSDGGGAPLTVTGGGGTTTTPETDNGGGTTGGTNPTTPTPTPAVTYVITFNANDGSPNPATVPQNFTGGIPQALTPVEELGFSKTGFSFAGWGTAPKSKQASYADGASYTATANTTLYALWSESPVFSVNIPVNPNGSVFATPATATAGTEITLSNTPAIGYQSASYSVTDADGGTVAVTNGKFTMPAKNVTVTATFNVEQYRVFNTGECLGGYVDASNLIVSPGIKTATFGTIVTLTAIPESGYVLATLTVTATDGTPVSLSGTGNSRTFTMPAKNVNVYASFEAIKYNVNVGTFANGSVTTTAMAAAGTNVTLTARPVSGYQLSMLVVTDEDGAAVSLSGTGNNRTFTMPAKSVTVTATFAVLTIAAYTETGTVTINGTEYDLVTFGLWPQTIKDENVTVDESVTERHGDFTYCNGSDGQWYVKQDEKAHTKCKYSDGTRVAQGGTSYKWFKVEPIKWRVLTKNYNGTSKKLLLAENILTNCAYYDYYVNRTIGGNSVYPGNWEHSKVRAFLNGRSYQNKASDSATQAACDDFLDKGFLQTAFSVVQIAQIASVSVDNSVRSTLPDNYNDLGDDEKHDRWNDGNNLYASDTLTAEKVFLLSEREVTTSAYGFDDSNAQGAGNTRIKIATDFAMASGALQEEDERLGFGGSWWLRSPGCDDKKLVRFVPTCALAWGYEILVAHDFMGVVPALCVEN